MAWLKLLQVCDDVENHFYRNDDFISAWTDYYTYGGLPLVAGMKTHKEKSSITDFSVLQNLTEESFALVNKK